MKKKGFTLQEALITVGIIGVIAAITIPAITKMMPNPYQTKYLKIYEAVTNITKEMLVDSSLYWNNNGCDGLTCANVPTAGSVPNDLRTMIDQNTADNNNAAPPWIRKYAAILAYNLHVNNQDLALNAQGQNVASFITSDGTIWALGIFTDVNGNNVNNTIGLTIDLNQVRNDAQEAPPDTYILRIDSDGNVTPADAFGIAYLEDPSSLKKSDIIQLAEQIRGDENINVMFAQETNMIDLNAKLCELNYPAFCGPVKYNISNIGVGQGSNLLHRHVPGPND